MQYSVLRTWLKNLSRTVVVTIGVLVALFFYYSLHKILSFSGVVIGSFVVLITPSLVHYKVVATSQCDKTINILIVIYAACFALTLGTLIIIRWE